MVSKLYKADKFYNMQSKGDIASVYSSNQKLKKDNDGYFLYREKKDGRIYKQRVKDNDRVYTRQETGVTKYSAERDRDITDVRHKKQTGKEHQAYAHMYDRKAKGTNKVYKI